MSLHRYRALRLVITVGYDSDDGLFYGLWGEKENGQVWESTGHKDVAGVLRQAAEEIAVNIIKREADQ